MRSFTGGDFGLPIGLVDLSLHHLTQDELLTRLEFHMTKIQEWSEKEEVAKLNEGPGIA